MFDAQQFVADAFTVKAKINTLARDIYLTHGEPIGEAYDFQKGITELARKCWNAAVIVYFNTTGQYFSDDDVGDLLVEADLH
ncbi:MAG: hypothetical protein LWW83_06365 [Azonexaceae bacterium]|nr:hypothetical protein [Azonexaceae bacterium]